MLQLFDENFSFWFGNNILSINSFKAYLITFPTMYNCPNKIFKMAELC